MKRIFVIFVLSILVNITVSRADTESKLNKIDFEDLLIKGQTKQSETIYLFDRASLEFESMVWKRQNFLDEIKALNIFEKL